MNSWLCPKEIALENFCDPSPLLSCVSIACLNSRSSLYLRIKRVFGIFPEFLQCLIKRMLSGIGVKALEQLRRGRHLQLDGGNKAQNIIPLILNKTFADVAIRQQRVSLRLVVPAVLKGVELLAAQSFDPRCKLETQEVSYAKD